MRVLLIQPPFHRTKGLIWAGAHLGLGYLSSTIQTNNHHCSIYNAEQRQSKDNIPLIKKQMERYHNYYRYLNILDTPNHPIWNEAKSVIKNYKPDLVGITFTSPAIDSAFKLAQITKENDPHTPVVMGGPHATVYPENILRNPYVDYVILGEGEQPFLNLVTCLSEQKTIINIPGVCTKNDSNIHISKPDKRITDIDTLPYPDRNTIPMNRASNYTSILGTRGCFFNCSFCSSRNVWGHKVTIRSPKTMVEELLFLKNTYHTNDFYIYDDTFTTNPGRVEEFCDLLHGKGIRWGCSTRIDRIDEQIIQYLKQGGCTQVDLGIESADENLLALIHKKITLSDIKQGINLVKKLKMPFGAFFMVGFPDETKETLQKTHDMMKNIEAQHLMLTILTPYPGTPLFEELKKQHILHDDIEWKYYSTDSPFGLLVQHMDTNMFWNMFSKMSLFVDQVNIRNPKAIVNKYSRYIRFFMENPKISINKLTEGTLLN